MCLRCETEKPIDAFGQGSSRGRHTRLNTCRTCVNIEQVEKRARRTPEQRAADAEYQRAWALANPDRLHIKRLRRYNITVERYDQMLAEQGGACASCGTDDPGSSKNQRFCIDHDHACCPTREKSCGKCVRGLLCFKCNIMAGWLETERAALVGAYLERVAA